MPDTLCKECTAPIDGKRIATKNGKPVYRTFCNSSCAASYNNRKKPKRKLEGKCGICAAEIPSARSYCDGCLPAVRALPRRSQQRLPLRYNFGGLRHPLHLGWSGHVEVVISSRGHYVAVRCPEHPRAWANGYIYEHRLVAECKLQRLLDEEEEAHHINEQTNDNRAENIEVLTVADHRAHHAAKRQISKIELTCTECKTPFLRERRQVKPGRMTFCSSSCNGRFQRRLQLSTGTGPWKKR